MSYKYLDVLWTIPVEFRGSMIQFTFCVAAFKLSTRNGMLLCWFLMIMAWYWAAVYVALFLGGLFLVDLSFTWNPERLGPPTFLPPDTTDISKCIPRQQPLREMIFYSVVLICALFLLSQVGTPSKAIWPWPLLDSLVPSHYQGSPVREHWWLSIGALLLV